MTVDELADSPPECYRHMHREDYREGVKQMLADLELLAVRDGCIAAAWALTVIREMPDHSKERP